MPNPLDVYRVTMDPSLDPAGKRAALDMLYSGGPAAPATLPDASMAQVDPSSIMAGSGGVDPSTVAPAPPPVATDAGGMSGAPAMSEAPAVSLPPPAPEANASPIPPGLGSSPPAPHAEQRRALTPEEAKNNLLGNAFDEETRGYAPRHVKAHDQKLFTEKQHMDPVPDEIKDRIETSQQAEQGLALAEGDRAAAAKLEEAQHLDEQAFAEQADRKAFEARNHLATQAVAQKEQEFQKAVEDSKQKPNSWWTDKTSGEKAVTWITALMFGLAQDPKGLDKFVDAHAEAAKNNRTARLSGLRSQIDTLKAKMVSPEAAAQMDRAMSYHVMATEAERYAAVARAPEIKANTEAVVQHLQTQAAEKTEAAWRLEHGAEMTKIAHVPDQYVGGRAPSALRAAKSFKDSGLSPEGGVRAATGGSYDDAGKEDDPERRVTFPDGTPGYAAKSERDSDQAELDAIGAQRENNAAILQLMQNPGLHSVGGVVSGKLKARIASNVRALGAQAKGEGANARFAGEMLKIMEPLTGEGAISGGTSDATAIAQIREANAIAQAAEDRLRKKLTPGIKANIQGGKVETLGSAKGEAAIENGAVPKE